MRKIGSVDGMPHRDRQQLGPPIPADIGIAGGGRRYELEGVGASLGDLDSVFPRSSPTRMSERTAASTDRAVALISGSSVGVQAAGAARFVEARHNVRASQMAIAAVRDEAVRIGPT
jgi:hypothetical protein